MLLITFGLLLLAIGCMIMITIAGFFVGLPIAWVGWWMILIGIAKKVDAANAHN